MSTFKSKLLKWKDWLYIPDTAKYLSIDFGEEVTEADVLQFASDGHLKLSVRFVNPTHAIRGGKFLPFDEWAEKFRKELSWESLRPSICDDKKLGFSHPEFEGVIVAPDVSIIEETMADLLPPEQLKKNYLEQLSVEVQQEKLSMIVEAIIDINKERSKKFGGKVPPGKNSFTGSVETIEGLFDLPMLGAELRSVMRQHQWKNDGPDVSIVDIDGTFVEGEDGRLFKLVTRYDWEDLRREDNHAERIKWPYNDPRNYCPAGGLPEDGVLVVRKSALLDFQERNNENQSGDRTINPKVEKSNLHIIGALLQLVMDKKLFTSEEALREHLATQYQGYLGCSERSLAGRFSEAKKLLSE